MRANPGGIVSPADVIGRDRLIARLWATLERQGLVLVAERRMGKTAIIKKMEAEPPPGLRVLYLDIEGVSRAGELVECVAQAIRVRFGTSGKAAKWLADLWSGLGGLEVAGILKLPESKGPHWKAALERLLGGLGRDPERPMVLILDELPWMLQKTVRTEGESVVVDLLDVLRGLRQTHAGLRLVYTGSIGLHHVVAGLLDEGFVNSPLNDMRIVEVPPLAPGDAACLADALLRGEGLADGSPDDTAERLAELVDCVPYYIHHVVAALADRGQKATRRAVESAVEQALVEAQDPWNLEHYRSRLGEYYGERAGLARAVLDVLAETGPLDLSALHERLKIDFRPDNELARRIVEGDRDGLRALIKPMQRDHYLAQDGTGAYGFRFPLVRRWWRLDLGLAR